MCFRNFFSEQHFPKISVLFSPCPANNFRLSFLLAFLRAKLRLLTWLEKRLELTGAPEAAFEV